MSLPRLLWRACFVLALLASFARHAEANLILNGSFESGSFTDWVVGADPIDPVLYVSGRPHSGTYAAWFGSVGNTDETISQTFNTIAGETYTVDFWLAHGRSWSSNDFNVTWTDPFETPVSLAGLLNTRSFEYTHYVFTHVAIGSSATVQFGGRDMMSFYYLDDVTVSGPQGSALTAVTVPEPGTWGLIAFGLAVLLGVRRAQLLMRLQISAARRPASSVVRMRAGHDLV